MGGLMHPRVAANYAAKGYYPTDDATLRGISHLLASNTQTVVFFDPTCGEGEALAQLSLKAKYPCAQRYGIELDGERASTAKNRLTQVLQASALDAYVAAQSVSCLFLNPPYGWDLRGENDAKSERLEQQFVQRSFACLKSGGVIIAVLPKTSMDRKMQNWFALRFHDIRVFEAATDRFQQIVIIGSKRYGPGSIDSKFNEYMEAGLSGEIPFDPLPTKPVEQPYQLSCCEREFKMNAKALDAEGLQAVRSECPNLWQDFQRNFVLSNANATIRPLHELTDWHTCLLISSGVVGGIVDNGRQKLLIKGRTNKVQTVKTIENEDGEVISAQHHDKFETVIKAIDLTQGSARYGQVLDIR